MSGIDGCEMKFNPHNFTVTIGDDTLELLYQEYNLLEFLVSHRGEVFSRDSILQEVWKVEGVVVTRTVDMHISRLRKKLSKYPTKCKIHTIRSKGYTFS